MVAWSGGGQVKQIASLFADVFRVELKPSQSFAHTYKNGTEKYFSTCLICDNGKFMAGAYETKSEGFFSVGSHSHCVSPELSRSRRLSLELWGVKFTRHTHHGW